VRRDSKWWRQEYVLPLVASAFSAADKLWGDAAKVMRWIIAIALALGGGTVSQGLLHLPAWRGGLTALLLYALVVGPAVLWKKERDRTDEFHRQLRYREQHLPSLTYDEGLPSCRMEIPLQDRQGTSVQSGVVYRLAVMNRGDQPVYVQACVRDLEEHKSPFLPQPLRPFPTSYSPHFNVPGSLSLHPQYRFVDFFHWTASDGWSIQYFEENIPGAIPSGQYTFRLDLEASGVVVENVCARVTLHEIGTLDMQLEGQETGSEAIPTT